MSVRSEPAEETGHDRGARLLFGGELSYDTGFSRHDGYGMRLRFFTMVRRTPGLLAVAVRLAWSADRAALITVAMAEVVQGVASSVGLLFTNQVLTQLLGDGPTVQRLRESIPALTGVGIAMMVAATLASLSVAATGRLEPKVERLASVTILRHASQVSLADIEDPEFHRLLDSAQYGTDAARRAVGGAVATVNATLMFLSAAGVLTVLHPALLPLLLLVAAPKGWGAVQTARRTYASAQSWLQHLRARRVVAALLTEQQAAAEIRVHGSAEFLLEQYENMAADAETEQTRLALRNAGTQLKAASLSGIAAVVAYASLALLLARDVMPLAVAGTAVLAIRTGTANLSLLVGRLNQLYEEGLYLNDYRQLCHEAQERHAAPAGRLEVPTDPGVMTMEKVTFGYPGKASPVLQDVSMTIKRGEVIALVGENGSGKTTLAKLLCGLYTPNSGKVTWDGRDTRSLDRRQLFEHVALVSQDFKRFPFTARVNVTIGRHGRRPQNVALGEAASYSGADVIINALKKGWETLLARQFTGGAELSGGQWQRIGLARARFRDAALMICDEPTSALDPKAEIEVFDRIRGLADEGRTVLLITHRLASVRHADRIYVLRNGRIVETGTHEELLAAEGHFNALYQMQARQYGQVAPQYSPKEIAEA
ncbi:ABC transporter [Streptomyces virginiae]|uniref:ABC transporter n=1 Tax=Streptomyces virginiae TaxID=1961 RepID=A0A0L8MZN2_STRVG|nr:ABC transporter ATP-binding protein [Streptomyces virginiae]KOG55750.1 ABC transporter [Streptomyces virginiae]